MIALARGCFHEPTGLVDVNHGMKHTGGGRELDSFREVKPVHWDIEARPKGWWLPYHKAAIMPLA